MRKLIEKAVESYLTDRVEKCGGICWKFVAPGTAGVPDRIVMLPGGFVAFVETKRPGGKTRALQDVRLNQIKKRGCRAYVLDTRDKVDTWVEAAVKGWL